MNKTTPKGSILIAEGNGYAVRRLDDEDLGTFYILKGLADGKQDYIFNYEEWDKFASTVACADLKIRGRIE